jgi:hypothetical protein
MHAVATMPYLEEKELYKPFIDTTLGTLIGEISI